ncbi:hypothetical protein [Lutibacter sp.]
MKKIIFLSFIGILIYSCSSSKISKKEIIYLDENNNKISKSKFNQIWQTDRLYTYGDSINSKKLALREQRGKISSRTQLEVLLEKKINQKLDSSKPIVIIYYPGKDYCNSNGVNTKKRIKNWYGKLEKGLYQIAKIKPIYIYKNNENLQEYDGIVDWKKDPKGTIERLFFTLYYPCSSFVVISKDGDYISYFSEFSQDLVWEATQQMNE